MKNVVALDVRAALVIVTCCGLASCQDELKPTTSPYSPASQAPSKRQQEKPSIHKPRSKSIES